MLGVLFGTVLSLSCNVRHLSGDAEWAVGYRSLAFRGEIWTND